jgi:hypothetical protein
MLIVYHPTQHKTAREGKENQKNGPKQREKLKTPISESHGNPAVLSGSFSAMKIEILKG